MKVSRNKQIMELQGRVATSPTKVKHEMGQMKIKSTRNTATSTVV